jgi:hypothetical protein
MKSFLVTFLIIGMLTGCATSSVAMHPVSPAPTKLATPIALHPFKSTAYTLGPWPDAGGPFVVMSIGDGPRDDSGVRLYIVNGKAYQDPVAQAQDGLAALVSYAAHKETSDLILAEKEAERLITDHVTNAATGDAWWFPYPFNFPEYGDVHDTAVAPWYSGMAQGEALDLFTRLYIWTGNKQWISAASHTFASFLYPLQTDEAVTARPWSVQVDSNGYLWVEEYPTPNAQDDTINGFGFALFGLIDYARLSGDARALQLADAGLTTFLYGVSLVRHPGHVSSYSVSHPAAHFTGYHVVVTLELTLFGAVTGDAQFTTLANAFYQDYH